MSFRVRPATGEDFRSVYEMAKLTGGGFTNLPPERATLVAKLAKYEATLRLQVFNISGHTGHNVQGSNFYGQNPSRYVQGFLSVDF